MLGHHGSVQLYNRTRNEANYIPFARAKRAEEFVRKIEFVSDEKKCQNLGETMKNCADSEDSIFFQNSSSRLPTADYSARVSFFSLFLLSARVS